MLLVDPRDPALRLGTGAVRIERHYFDCLASADLLPEGDERQMWSARHSDLSRKSYNQVRALGTGVDEEDTPCAVCGVGPRDADHRECLKTALRDLLARLGADGHVRPTAG
jgi:hypothetical protein